MSMLLDKASGLSSKLDEKKSIETNAHQVDTFEDRQTQIATIEASLKRSIEKLSLYRENQFDLKLDVDLISECKQVVTTTLEAYQESKESITQNPRRFTTLKNKTTALADAIIAAIRNSWTEYFEERSQTGVGYEVASHYARTVAEGEHLLEHLQDQQDEFEKYSTQPPSSQDGFDRFNQLVNERSKLLDSIPDIPPEIETFLRRAGAGGLPFSQLNDHIMNWMRDNNLLDHFVVKPSVKRSR